MSIINRITTWTSQILTSASLNGEFNNIVNTLNNVDSGTTAFTNLKAGVLTSTGITTIKGSATNDAAVAGNVGEYISSVVGPVNFPASTSWGDATSLSLTAGDWDVSLTAMGDRGTATAAQFTAVQVGISTTSGNSGAGLTLGDSELAVTLPGGMTDCALTICGYRESLTGNTTIYAKMNASYVSGQPAIYCRITARRAR